MEQVERNRDFVIRVQGRDKALMERRCSDKAGRGTGEETLHTRDCNSLSALNSQVLTFVITCGALTLCLVLRIVNSWCLVLAWFLALDTRAHPNLV